jgi:hypothetical protein
VPPGDEFQPAPPPHPPLAPAPLLPCAPPGADIVAEGPVNIVEPPGKPAPLTPPVPPTPILTVYTPAPNDSNPEIYELELITLPDNAVSFVFNPPAPAPPDTF